MGKVWLRIPGCSCKIYIYIFIAGRPARIISFGSIRTFSLDVLWYAPVLYPSGREHPKGRDAEPSDENKTPEKATKTAVHIHRRKIGGEPRRLWGIPLIGVRVAGGFAAVKFLVSRGVKIVY